MIAIILLSMVSLVLHVILAAKQWYYTSSSRHYQW